MYALSPPKIATSLHKNPVGTLSFLSCMWRHWQQYPCSTRYGVRNNFSRRQIPSTSPRKQQKDIISKMDPESGPKHLRRESEGDGHLGLRPNLAGQRLNRKNLIVEKHWVLRLCNPKAASCHSLTQTIHSCWHGQELGRGSPRQPSATTWLNEKLLARNMP